MRIVNTEEQISGLEDRLVELNQPEEQNKNIRILSEISETTSSAQTFTL